MRFKEFATESRVDEFLPALAAGAGAVAGAAARAIPAVASGIGSAVAAGGRTVMGAGRVAARGTGAAVNGVTDAIKTASQIKNAVGNMKSVLKTAGGSDFDIDKLSKALALQQPGQPLDTSAMKSLQGVLPAFADALKNPQTATALKQVFSQGVQSDLAQQKQTQQPTTAQPNTTQPIQSTGV
jgi:enamine deaminase RidA (YjgF/YER057c/UK114 family)